MDVTNELSMKNLDGIGVGETFLGCLSCGWRLDPGSACDPVCPDCGERLKLFTVTDDDLLVDPGSEFTVTDVNSGSRMPPVRA